MKTFGLVRPTPNAAKNTYSPPGGNNRPTSSSTAANGSMWARSRSPKDAEHVGAHDVARAEADVDLRQDPPAAMAAPIVVVVERPANEAPDGALRSPMLGQRARSHHHLPADDLGPHVLRQPQQGLVGRLGCRGLHRGQDSRIPSITSRAPGDPGRSGSRCSRCRRCHSGCGRRCETN